MITLITGGSGSGKSAYAEKYICHVSNEKGCKEKYYIATMQVFDDEGQQKIDRHRRLRAGKGFITIEQPRDIQNAVSKLQSESSLKTGRSALLECMSNLVANEFFSDKLQSIAVWERKETVVHQVMRGVERLAKSCGEVIIVTNELFSDGIDYDEGTREYLSVLGKINQEIAARADRVIEVVAGIPVVWKGAES